MKKCLFIFMALVFAACSDVSYAEGTASSTPGAQRVDLGDDDSDDSGSGAGGGGHFMTQEDGYGDPFDSDSGNTTDKIGNGEDNMGATD